MKFEGWYLVLGILMLAVTFLDRLVKRLPITTTIVYLAVGIILGPIGFNVASIHPLEGSTFLERITEIAVIVSLFTAGLKLRAPLTDTRWKLPVRLAFVSMALTVGLIASFAILFLDLPVAESILLGAILAPTDPVLASDVQLEHPHHRDRLRFSLTAEAGLNDGTAFPFVMLGLGLLGLHELGQGGWRWFCVDLIWAVGAGLGIGGLLGTIVGKFLVHLRNKHEETMGRDEFICLGLIGISYGAALFLHAYGFLAVFAAGLALRHIELRSTSSAPRGVVQSQSDPDESPAYAPDDTPRQMARGVLGANEQLERILEIGLVLMLGSMLSRDFLTRESLWLALAVFLVIRPLAVVTGTISTNATKVQKTLLGWFGIRGIGSLYYLMYAIQHGLSDELSHRLIGLVLCVITISIFVHGVSATPIMNFYERRKKGRTVGQGK